ncbi:MAG TPA: DUF6789 family protein [Thermodesulfobacteriota bacterium]
MTRLLDGAVAGVIGTTAMSALLVLSRTAGLMGPPPPRRITERIARRSGVEEALSGEAFEASWVAAHFAYGAACGALYALARRALPASPVASGLLFGGLVWAGSYLGLLPALRIYRGPDGEESAPTTATMIAAHAVYGVTTALAEERIEGPDGLLADDRR